MKRSLIVAAFLSVMGLQAQNPLQLKLNNWATGLADAVGVAHCGDSRLFVVQQAGIIRVVTDSMTVLPTPFLNITSTVYDVGNEQGLLGLAFDPDHANNGFFYVHYTGGTGNGISTIARYTVSADSNVADVGSAVILYTWPQPFPNHNGGDIHFGPDGHLYIALGDGGSAGDPQGNAQDPTDPLGNLLRIHPEADSTYSIPADNPWANAGGDTLPEIWASGLRNPFRFGFDQLTGDLWIGDVGQNDWEEVDYWPAGSTNMPNFGWRCYEGNATFNTSGCQGAANYVFPVAVHSNVANGGTWCSSIGGRVYRGTEYPRMYGRYFYTDYCAGHFWSLRPNGLGGWIDEDVLNTGTAGFSSVTEGYDGSLYTTNVSFGTVQKIVDKCPMPAPSVTSDGFELSSTTANSYQWYWNGAAVPGATGQTYVPANAGDYYVVGQFTGGCSLISDTLTFIATGLGEQAAEHLQVFPQPAKDQVVLQRSTEDQVAGMVRMVDEVGREVLNTRWSAGATQLALNVERVPNGTYVVLVENSAGMVLHRAPVMVMH
ncbi:MAG: PQQ-dependent sugar dehydrogenase [Flavobacteriales bacterium]|nr:PQQ-dependent sugar dehydrogenase [Flavobacteriales bacterium]